MSCTGRKASTGVAEQRVDSLNEIAYRWHYRQVDSVRKWATLALEEAREVTAAATAANVARMREEQRSRRNAS